MAYTSFCSAWEKEILHSLSACFPSLCPIATKWHPLLMMSSTTWGGGHEWHLSFHEEAEGGQNSLAKQWALSYSNVRSLPLLHGPCTVESGHLCFVRVHVLSLNIALEIQRAPLILTQEDNTSLCASSIGNQSRVNPGGLSEMSQRISVYLCVVHVQRSLRKVPEQSVVICPDGDVLAAIT